MQNEITITNVLKIQPWIYSIFFTLNFTPIDLYYETSLDGVNWNIPKIITNYISPNNVIIETTSNFYIRLSSTIIPEIHNNIFNNIFN